MGPKREKPKAARWADRSLEYGEKLTGNRTLGRFFGSAKLNGKVFRTICEMFLLYVAIAVVVVWLRLSFGDVKCARLRLRARVELSVQLNGCLRLQCCPLGTGTEVCGLQWRVVPAGQRATARVFDAFKMR